MGDSLILDVDAASRASLTPAWEALRPLSESLGREIKKLAVMHSLHPHEELIEIYRAGYEIFDRHVHAIAHDIRAENTLTLADVGPLLRRIELAGHHAIKLAQAMRQTRETLEKGLN